jgi:S-DNA-T family DNA segregation ATPase FtsK/SpoIIIE
VRLLPSRIDLADLPPGGAGIPIGVDENRLACVELDPAAEPHLLCFSDAESGKTALLRLVAHAIVTRLTPEQARIVVVDHRRSLLGAVPGSHLIGYASTPEQTAASARSLEEFAAQAATWPGGHASGAAGAHVVARAGGLRADR